MTGGDLEVRHSALLFEKRGFVRFAFFQSELLKRRLELNSLKGERAMLLVTN